MARKKKVEEQVVETVETPIQKEEKEEKVIINTKETYMFQITPLAEVKLYKYPTDKTPQGKLKKGQVCGVTCEINYTPMKMYRLDTGYYIVADHNIKKI